MRRPNVVLLGSGLGGADAPGEGGLGVVGHGSRLLCWAARPAVEIGSGRGGVSSRKPQGSVATAVSAGSCDGGR